MFCTIKQIADWCREHDDFIVITHARPDGDAYGCAIAATLALRAIGKRAFPACDDPVETKYRFLPLSDEFADKDHMPYVPKTALAVDCGDGGRMKQLEDVFNSCSDSAVIDHHGTNEGFGDLTYLEGNAAAAGELILKLIRELGIPFTKDMATCIYTAVSTDSGNFSFRDTSAQSFDTASECMKAGIDIEILSRTLFRQRSLVKTKLIALALSDIVMSKKGYVAAVKVTDEMFEKAGAERPDSHSIVNYMNEIDGVKVGILCEQNKDGVKISFRSGDGTDVSELAKQFDGGGHKAASGGRILGAKLEDEFMNIVRASAAFVGDTL